MAQERRSSQRGGRRVIGLPGQSRWVPPRYGGVDWQTLPMDSTTRQWFWQQLGETEPTTPDTVAAVQSTPARQDTVPPPPPSVQQPTSTGAQATNTGTGTTPPTATPPASQPAPVPGTARQRATAASQQSLMRGQYQLASLEQQAQRIGIESAMQPLPVPEPVGEKIESRLQRLPNYTATLENLLQQTLEGGYQPFTFWLGAAVPATSTEEALGLVRDIQPFVRDYLQRLQAQPGQAAQVSRLQKLLTALSSDENLRSAIMQEARRLLETAIQSKSDLAQYYEGLVKDLKGEEAWLQQQISQIPENLRVMSNQKFVGLYNRYLQVQRDIMNTAALVAANNNVRINWQNLLDHAIANLARPAFDLLPKLPLAVPSYDAVENVWMELQNLVEDNEKLKPAVDKLKAIRAYSGKRLSIGDSATVARLHQEYVEALRQAGLEDETVDRLSSIVYSPGSLPGLGWSPGPIIEQAQPIIGFLQPAQLSGAQLPNVEAPVPASRGGGGASRASQYLLNVEAVGGFDRPVINASNRQSLVNSFAERENIAGTAYIPYEDFATWSRLAHVASGGKSGARIQIGSVVFDLAQARSDPNYWNTFVNNIRDVLTEKQSAGAYTQAVGDINAYLATLAASARSDRDFAGALDAVRGFFASNRSLIGKLIHDSVANPPSLWSNFLRQLSQRSEARPILQHLGNPALQEAVRMALIGGIVRYISKIHGAVTVNGETITGRDPNLKMGIIGLLLGNLFKIAQ
jgi:hypothetical protein